MKKLFLTLTVLTIFSLSTYSKPKPTKISNTDQEALKKGQLMCPEVKDTRPTKPITTTKIIGTLIS
jgi:hypothetical protein